MARTSPQNGKRSSAKGRVFTVREWVCLLLAAASLMAATASARQQQQPATQGAAAGSRKSVVGPKRQTPRRGAGATKADAAKAGGAAKGQTSIRSALQGVEEALAAGQPVLATADFDLIGLAVTAGPASQTVPKNTPTSVLTSMLVPEGSDASEAAAGVNPNYRVRGELSGPSLGSPVTIEAAVGQPLRLPALSTAGDHVVQNLRVVDVGAEGQPTVAPVMPDACGVVVIERLLVSEVHVRELTYEQIVQAGINISDDSYRFFNFTLGVSTTSSPQQISIPVAFPGVGVADPRPVVGTPLPIAPGVSVPEVVPDILPVMLEVEGGRDGLDLPPDVPLRIPGVVVFPGRIGLLHQFFEATVIVANGAPAGTPLVVHSLKAKVRLPDAGTPGDASDDPLRMAETQAAGRVTELELHDLGADGKYGTADDVNRFAPGKSGQGSFLVEGMKEGLHTINFDLEGTLEGLPAGPVTVRGEVPGAVVVRDASFGVTFSHPSVVRAGQEYDLALTLYNSGQRDIQSAVADLMRAGISGAELLGGEVRRQFPPVVRGESATVRWRLRANVTGAVTASYAKVGADISAGLSLVTGVGDRNVPLSPDSIILPDTVSNLPPTVVEAARAVLGQAWSIATAPEGGLPEGVVKVDKRTVVNRAVQLGIAGLRAGFGEPASVSHATLMRDWLGELEAEPDAGFADVLRDTQAGFDFYDSVGAESARLLGEGRTAADILGEFVAAESPRSPFVLALVTQALGTRAAGARLADGTGRAVGFGGEPSVRSGELRSGASLRLLAAAPGGTGGEEVGQMLFASRPSNETWSLELTGEADGVVNVALALPVSGGTYRHLVVEGVQVTRGGRHRLTFRPSGTGAVALEEFRDGSFVQTGTAAATAATVSEPAPRVVGLMQVTPDVLAGGDKYGRLVGLLFSKPMTKAAAETAANYTIGGGALASNPAEQVGGAVRALGAKVDYGDRFVFLSLDAPVGPFIERTLGVAGLTDRRGAALAPAPANLPIPMRVSPQGVPPGAYLTGRVLGADGSPVAGAQVIYWTQECDSGGLTPPEPKPLAQRLTDADGRYAFDYVRNGDCGPLLVTVKNPVTRSEKRLTTPVAYHGQHMTLDMVFLARGSVRGTISMGGRPLPNAVVQVIPSLDAMGSKVVQADGFGQYAAGDIPVGNVSILAVGTGVAANASGVAAGTIEGPGRTATVNVTLQNVSGVVRGRVVNPDTGASPAAGALVVAYARIPGFGNEQRGDGMTPVGWVNASREGNFALENLPVGDITLEVTDYVTALVARRQVQLSAGTPEVGGVVITLPGFGTVSGQVVDETGGFVPGAVVQGAGRAVQADGVGLYTLQNMPAGTHRITATDPATLMSGSVDVEVRLGQNASGINIPILRPATITGRVFMQEQGAAAPVPAAGVFVTVNGYTRVQADAEGRYTVKNVKPNTNVVLRFVDLGRNYVINMPVVVTPGETLTRNATFRPGSIRGRVTQPDGVTGSASPISLYSPMPILTEGENWGKVTTERPRSTQSGGDGAYRVDGVNPGTFRVTTASPFFPTPVSAGGVLPPNGDVEVNFSLVDTLAGKIQGVVYRPDGTSPAGAGVKVTLGGGALADVTVTTDAEGRYEFAEVFAEGGYWLTATDPATAETNRVRISVQKNKDVIADVRLRGRGALRVSVVDGAGNPVQNGQLSLAGGEYPNAQRYIDLTPAMGGVFEFGNLPEGPYAISANQNGLAGRASADVAAGSTVEVTVQLQASGTVRGRAFTPDGVTPIGLADVELRLGGRQVGFSVTSDTEEERGSFSFLNVPVGDFQLDVFDNRTGRVGRATGQLTAQGQVAEVNVKLLPVGAVAGRVTANGQPVDHALVEIHANGSGIRAERMKATTDAEGRYRFTGVPVGSFQINVTGAPGGQTGAASGFVSGTSEPLADTVVDIALEPSVTVTGSVRALSGEAVNGARVTVLVGNRRYETGTNEQGVYRISYVPLGEVRVRAEAPAGYDRGEAATVAASEPGATLTSDVTLAGTGSVSGTAYNNDGSPLSTGTVTYTNDAWSGARITLAAPVQSNGRYEIKGAPAGPFALKLTVTNRVGAGSASGEIAAGAALDLPVRLEDAGQVTGRLKSVDGASPAVGADVTLSLRTPSNQTFRFYGHTDTQGLFLFKNVPLGSASVGVNDATTGGVARYATQALASNGQTLDLGTATLDNVPVAVEAVAPADGSAGVSPAEPAITVRFSEAVDPSTVNAGTVRLLRGQNGVSAGVTLSDGDRTAAVKPSGRLADLTAYTLVVTTFVSDQSGNHLAREVRSTFTTADATPPGVASVSPAGGAVEVPLDSSVAVTFNEPLAAGQDFAAVFKLAPEASPSQAVAGAASLDESRRVLTFDPAADLEDNAVYRVTVTGQRDDAGNVQSQVFSSTFKTHIIPGQGDVIAQVVGPDDKPAAGAQLTLTTVSGNLAATAGADGRHTFRRVPLGEVSLLAVEPATGIRGRASGSLATAGQSLTLAAKLFASGTVSGAVTRADGTTPAAGAEVKLVSRSNSSVAGSTVTNAAGLYSVDYVPVGDFNIEVRDPSTGDRAVGRVQIAVNGETRSINLSLTGFGAVRVTVRDASDQLVSNAPVTFTSASGFAGPVSASTQPDGTALFEKVFAGAFTVAATHPSTQLTVSQAGTLAPGTTAEVAVKLVPTGTIVGTVFAPDGTTPAQGMTVRLLTWQVIKEAQTGADGRYRFDSVPLSSYTVNVVDASSRLRARAASVTVTTNGETVTRDLTAAGLGSVKGLITKPDNTPVANVTVSLRSSNPAIGAYVGTLTAATDSLGNYRITNVPTGGFTASVDLSSQQLQGEATGQVAQDGQEVTANIKLVSNAVSLPTTRHDGNAYPYQVNADGSVWESRQLTFGSSSDALRNAARLQLVVNGSTLAFAGSGSIGSTSQGGREVVVRQSNLGGLNVTRRVYVPATGYFTRFHEVLENTTAAPVTVAVKVGSYYRRGSFGSAPVPRVITTSSGDAALGTAADAASADRWVVVDDDTDADPFLNSSGTTATAFVFDGEGAPERTSAASFTGNVSPSTLGYEWKQITVQPGETVAYLHFLVQQVSQAGARAAAGRLAQLPPEALLGITAEQAARVKNFNVPADGAGAVEPLPALTGKVAVRTLASDGTTLVTSAQVRLKSKHPLFGRTYTPSTSNGSGVYTFTSNGSGTSGGVNIPVHPFTTTATHSFTGVAAPPTDGDFPAGQDAATQDLIFRGSGNVRGVLRRHNGDPATTNGRVTVLTAPQGAHVVQMGTAADGSYSVTGLAPGNYTLQPSLANTFLTGPAVTVAVGADATVNADLVIEPSGSLRGTVRTAAGELARYAEVSVVNPANEFGGVSVQTDASGVYTVANLPARELTVRAYEPTTFTPTTAVVRIVQDQTTTQDFTLAGIGRVQVQVNYPNGTPAVGSRVHLNIPPSIYYEQKGTTDSGGRYIINSVPTRAFNVKADHPSVSGTYGTASGAVTAHGELVAVTVTLPDFGTLSGRATFPDGSVAANVQVNVVDGFTQFRSAVTDSAGNYTFTQIPVGRDLLLRSYDPVTFYSKDTPFKLTATGTSTVDLTMAARATVRALVRRPDGSAYGGVRVQYNHSNNLSFMEAGNTNFSGIRDIPNINEGAVTIRVLDSAGGELGSAVGAVTAADHNKTVTVEVAAKSNVISGVVYAGDGQTPASGARVRAYNAATGAELRNTTADAQGFYRLADLASAPGGYVVRAFSPASVTVSADHPVVINENRDPVTLNVTLPIGFIRGKVLRADGVTPVPDARTVGRYDHPTGGFSTWEGPGTNQSGDFVLMAEGAGSVIKVTATERTSFLSGSATVTIGTVTAPTPVSILMPPAGTVTGTVYDAAGNAMANARVNISTPDDPFGFTLRTDAQGVYRSDYVRVGKFRLQAVHPSFSLCATGGGTLGGNGETATADLRLAAGGTLRGRVYGADGAPLANTYVEARNYDQNGPMGYVRLSTYTDASGNYELTNLQVGALLVGAEDTRGNQAALVEYVLTDAGPGVVDLTIGNAFDLGSNDYMLDGADGFRYDVYYNGSFYNGGKVDNSLSDAYDWTNDLLLDGLGFSGFNFARIEGGGREVAIGPWKMWGLKVVRKVFSPAGGGFARNLEILTNTTGEEMTVRVQNEVALGSDGRTRVVVAPSETSNRFAVTDSDGACCNPTLAHVYDGAGSRLSPAPVPFVNGEDDYIYTWDVTIPAGRTVILMHFSAQRGLTDSAGARAQAEALVSLSDPAALEGMSDEEKSQVVNFQIPAAQAQSGSARPAAAEGARASAAAGAEAEATAKGLAPKAPQTQKRPPAAGAGGRRRADPPVAALGLRSARRPER